MVFPHYLVGIGVPLVVGLLAIGFYWYQQRNDEYNECHHSGTGPGYDTRRDYNYTIIDNCSICLEELEQPMQHLPCSHKLHRACYQKLIKSEKRCPVCRQSFPV